MPVKESAPPEDGGSWPASTSEAEAATNTPATPSY